MTGIDSWSVTAATNTAADGTSINWAEGQNPSTVNNSARQMMADVRAAFNDLIWFQYGKGDQGTSGLALPCVYASSTSFTIAGANVTTPFHAGRRVKAVGASTGTIYGYIVSSSFSTNTTVNISWDNGVTGLANETLTISLSQIPVTGQPLALPTFTKIQNAGSTLEVVNSSTGTAAYSGYRMGNGTSLSYFYLTGASFTPSGLDRADGTVLQGAGTGGLTVTTTQSQPVYIGVGNAEVARFTSSNLLVGKTTTAFTTAGTEIQTGGCVNISVSGTEGLNITRLASNGNMVRFFHTDGSTVIGSIVTSAGTTTTYNTSSDRRIKSNISDAVDAGVTIDSIKVRQFDMGGRYHAFGVVAQELYDVTAYVVPGAVTPGDDGPEVTEPWQIDPSKLVPLLIKEIQSLRRRIAALELRQ